MGELQDKMGQMRDQCKDGAAWIEFIKVAIMVSKVKNLEFGTDTPSVFKNGCPFAKDTQGKPIVTPEYVEVGKTSIACNCNLLVLLADQI